mmetsp:Transcript_13622/g.32251  ORF Transcript_13622/g.32251 Transcript_13622/m.32251 type:complete len:202 (-) Transcript_13622:1531-2136(-)
MSRRVFVGNLPQDIRERELEDLFYKFGRILEIDLKLPPRPPGFAFIEFEDPRDASAAVQGRDGYDFYGTRLRVELARGGSGRSTYGGGRRADRGYSAAPPPNAEFRVNVFGLPPTASWQDLKDHMRKAGDVSFAQVSILWLDAFAVPGLNAEGTGICFKHRLLKIGHHPGSYDSTLLLHIRFDFRRGCHSFCSEPLPPPFL